MKKETPQLAISDKKGSIFALPRLEAAGMKGGCFFRIDAAELIELPPASRLFMLPDRAPVGYDPCAARIITLEGDHYAVCAFVSPGYTTTYNAAYRETQKSGMLPLFSYSAVSFYKGKYYAACVRVDKDRRHDPRFININAVRKNTLRFKKLFPKNRLITHLKDCALLHGCPNAQNFFLSRYEAPLPTSPSCNSSCIGCISYQPPGRCPAAQPRIKFTPAPEEIAEVALLHIANVRNSIVSFGQGCEGEPLLAGGVIEKAIRIIRQRTPKGTININTNASRPDMLSRLFNAGLNSVRVSINSAREEYYARYYKPRGYLFKDVIRSIRIAKAKNKFVSINYLTMPGFTDSKDEFAALGDFIETNRPDMIQWRNLNLDPIRYFKELNIRVDSAEMLGIREIMNKLKKTFPKLKMGYFNPSRAIAPRDSERD